MDLDAGEQFWPWTNDDDLALALASIRGPVDIPDFVARYGLLTRGPEADEFSEPVELWLDAAKEARVYLRIGEYLHRSQDVDRDDWVAVMKYLKRTASLVMNAAANEYEQLEIDADEAREVAATVVAEGVSTRIVGKVEVALAASHQPDTTARLGLVVVPDDLMTFAFWRVAFLVTRLAEVRDCAGCHRLFSPTHARQKYHSRACANADRQRRYYKRNRSTSKR